MMTELSMVNDDERFEDHEGEEEDLEVEEVNDPMGTQASTKKTRPTNYNCQEDIVLCLNLDECLA